MERATVNVSLAEIINVTQPPIFSALFPKPIFRAAYSRLSEKISPPATGPAERIEVKEWAWQSGVLTSQFLHEKSTSLEQRQAPPAGCNG